MGSRALGCTILLEEKLIARFVKQILQGLLYLHKQGVIHRDIKGANILITKDRHVKLSDFGVSVKKHFHQAEEEDLDAVGTPYWMAPEIISLTGVSTESDIWSLGCTIVELLTGMFIAPQGCIVCASSQELVDCDCIFRCPSLWGPQ